MFQKLDNFLRLSVPTSYNIFLQCISQNLEIPICFRIVAYVIALFRKDISKIAQPSRRNVYRVSFRRMKNKLRGESFCLHFSRRFCASKSTRSVYATFRDFIQRSGSTETYLFCRRRQKAKLSGRFFPSFYHW